VNPIPPIPFVQQLVQNFFFWFLVRTFFPASSKDDRLFADVMSVLNPQCSLEISVKFESRAIICKAVTETRAVSLAATKRNEGRFGISECHRNSYPAVDGSRRRPAAQDSVRARRRRLPFRRQGQIGYCPPCKYGHGPMALVLCARGCV